MEARAARRQGEGGADGGGVFVDVGPGEKTKGGGGGRVRAGGITRAGLGSGR